MKLTREDYEKHLRDHVGLTQEEITLVLNKRDKDKT